ncbi:MAG TPA: SRPBCC family protein [Methylocella sp.]
MPGELAVRKQVRVNTHPAAAFAVFTQGHGRWWPLATHHMGPSTPETAVLEPFVGGRWFERAVDGTVYEWGRVLVWDPPHRLILAWQVNYDCKQIANPCTEVELLFIEEGPESTRVQLTHRHLDRYGEMGEKMHSIFNAENGWILVLQCFARATAAWPASASRQ